MKRRHKLLINSEVQFKLFFFILISILIPTGLCAVFMISLLINMAQISAEGETAIQFIIAQLNQNTIWVLLAGIASLTALLLAWVLISSHRLVGPLYRLEKNLDDMIEHHKIIPVFFRKNDYMHTVAQKLNQLLSECDFKESSSEE